MFKVFRCWAENHRHFVTNSSTGLSKLLSRCTWEQVEQKNFPMKTLHFLVPKLSGKFHFCPKVFWLGCQNCIPPGNRIILRKSILFEFFLYLFRTLSKKSSGFCRIFINWIFQNCILRVQKRSLRWTSFARSLWSFVYHFRPFRQKNLAFWQRNIAMFVKSAFWLSIGTIWREVFWKSFLATFRDLANKNFCFSSNNVLRGCQNCVLRA